MKHLIIVPLLTLAFILAACTGPVTKDNIRQNPVYSKTFSVNQAYQQVFDVLLKNSQSCYLNRPSSIQLTLVGNRDNGNKTANITLEYVYAMAEQDVILMLDITALRDEETRVNVYASRKGDAAKVDIIQKWLDDKDAELACA